MEDLRKKLVDRINYLCNEKNYSYYVLAYKADMSLTTLIHIMDGTSKNPGICTIYKICVGLGISLKDFFNDGDFEDWMEES
ncbi:MAG: helix-turn-helix domain-containing protein [Agathobacter sp.]|nr:helix-turn-helix domain-containing protein [Agathobacter sp.]